jgi:methyl-accepting chemotaxis protein
MHDLTRMIANVTRAMLEQAAATQQITTAAASMRQQCEQTARATEEQSRAMRDMTTAAQNTARQIARITQANREHSVASGTFLGSLREIRDVTEQNARAGRDTKAGTDDLQRHAHDLTGLLAPAGLAGANGRAKRANGRNVAAS